MKPEFKLIVANWKMQLSFNNAINYIQDNIKKLKELSTAKNATRIVFCPSFPGLFPIKQLLENSKIAVGAQNCSSFRPGAYTGQVSAESLEQTECHYCIVGHSESRLHNHETNEDIAEKTERLLEQEIQPIICIGENKIEYENKNTLSILESQLLPVIKRIADNQNSQVPIYIAYEPIWAIGTGITPTEGHLNKVFEWINKQTNTHLNKNRVIGLLYGGSISENNIARFKMISTISGFLIGGASLDFQKFNNIVNLV